MKTRSHIHICIYYGVSIIQLSYTFMIMAFIILCYYICNNRLKLVKRYSINNLELENIYIYKELSKLLISYFIKGGRYVKTVIKRHMDDEGSN